MKNQLKVYIRDKSICNDRRKNNSTVNFTSSCFYLKTGEQTGKKTGTVCCSNLSYNLGCKDVTSIRNRTCLGREVATTLRVSCIFVVGERDRQGRPQRSVRTGPVPDEDGEWPKPWIWEPLRLDVNLQLHSQFGHTELSDAIWCRCLCRRTKGGLMDLTWEVATARRSLFFLIINL